MACSWETRSKDALTEPVSRAVAIPGLLDECYAVISADGVDLVR